MSNKNLDNKEKTDVILSIGMLTYNNAAEVKRTLSSVMPQLHPGAEIVINDNSTDAEIETMVAKEFSSPYIRYFKNKENVGAERNLMLAVERSRGKYVWWFGDDELCDGAIRHVMDILRKEKDISFMFVNFHIADQGIDHPIIKISKDTVFKDKNQVLEELANVLGFMSSLIVRKDDFKNIDRNEIEHFIGSDFVHLFIVLHILSQGGKSYFVAFPYVRSYPTPAEKRSTYDGFSVFAVNFFKIVKGFEKSFRKKSIKKILAKNFGHIWRGELVGNVKRGNKPLRRLKTLFQLYWNFPEFWVALPFFLMPRFVNVLFYKWYKKIAGSNEFIRKRVSKVPWF